LLEAEAPIEALTVFKRACPKLLLIETPRVSTVASCVTSSSENKVDIVLRSHGWLVAAESEAAASSEKSTVLALIATLVLTASTNVVRIVVHLLAPVSISFARAVVYWLIWSVRERPIADSINATTGR